MRTDAAAALRAAKGILLTTYARHQAQGHQLDRDELKRLLGECMQLFASLGEYAGEHRGQATDTAGQKAVADAIQDWQASSDAGAPGVIACAAEGGAVYATPKTHLTCAGENIDHVAHQSVQITSGEQINLQAGHGVAMFAHAGGVSAIANQDKVLLQSQADDTQIDSAKSVQITAAGGTLAGAAREEVAFVTSGGAYLKLHGENIELGCPGTFTVKSAGHHWDGPASMSGDLPTFDHAPLGRVPKLVRASDGEGAVGVEANVEKASGDLRDQKTDDVGKLDPLTGDQLEQLAVRFIKKTI